MRVPRQLSAIVWSTPLGPLYKALRTRVYLRYSSSARARVFRHYLDANEWRERESRSGPGSTLEETRAIREGLPGFVRRNQICTLLDVPCGDFSWMRTVDLDGVRYIGADIVPALIDDLNTRFGGTAREFRRLDIVSDPLPAADAVLCRDLLIHLPNALCKRVLSNVKASGAKWLLTTTNREVSANVDCGVGDYRPIDLTMPPFNLPEPVETIAEGYGGQPVSWGRCLGIWRVADLP